MKTIGIIIAALLLMMSSFNSAHSQFVKAVVSVTGNVKDDLTKKAVAAEIKVFDNTGKKVNSVKSNPYEDGYYFITGLTPGNSYTLEMTSKAHLKEIFTISVPNTDKFLEISRDFNLKPLIKDVKLPLAVSPFEFNKYKLRFGSAVALDKFVNSLINNPSVKFTILSYPDTNENPEDNKELTRKRAEALVDFFVMKGVEPTRISIEESSQTDPNLPPPTEKRAKGKKYIGSTYIVINDF